MKKLVPFSPIQNRAINEFEEALRNAQFCYSLRDVERIGKIPAEKLSQALQAALVICKLAGQNSQWHFKQIYVYDENLHTLHTDWLLSRSGYNLMVMQIPQLNQNKAIWIWELVKQV
jgi:hypothetical protein